MKIKKKPIDKSLLKIKESISIQRVKKFSQKPFIRNVFTIASGTALAQVIAMLFSPILTRLYGPDSLGMLGVFTAVISIMAPIADLTFPEAIVLPAKDSDAKNLVLISFYTSILMTVSVTVSIIFVGETILGVLQLEQLEPFLLLIPVMMFFSSGVQIANQWFIRKGKFYSSTKINVFQVLIMNISKVLFGLFIPTAVTLIVIATISQSIYLILLVLSAGVLSAVTFKEMNSFRVDKTMILLAKKYRVFPIFRAPQAFINAVSTNLPILMLSTFFGPASAGFYSMGNKVLRIPINLISKAVGDVFYPRISKAYNNNEDLPKILTIATLSMFAIGIIPFGLLIVFGPSLFSFVFGSDWRTAGIYARWVGVWLFTSFFNHPAVKTLPVIGAQRFHLVHTVVTIGCKVAALAIGAIFLESDVIAIALYGIVGAIFNILLIIITVHKSKVATRAS